MNEQTEIAIQTEHEKHEKHVVIVEDDSCLTNPDPPQNILDPAGIKKILTDLEQQTKILRKTAKKIDMQKKIVKNLTGKVDEELENEESEDQENEESEDEYEYESAEEEVEVDIRWTAMLKLLDAHRNISESVHKLIHEEEEEE